MDELDLGNIPDPPKAQRLLGWWSLGMGVLGLTATVVPSLLALWSGTRSSALFRAGHRGSERDLGLAGTRLGWAGLAMTAVGIAYQVVRWITGPA